MYDYAIIIHPTNEELIYRYEPGMRRLSRPLVKKVAEWTPPFKVADIVGLRSNLDGNPRGALVMCPLLMEQMVTLSPHKVMASVLATIKFAMGLNTRLIGLTAYTAFSGNKGKDLAKYLNATLTTGSSYTLGLIPESILKAAGLMDIKLDRTQIFVIGATSSIGRFCIENLARYTPGIFITTANQRKLDLLLAEVSKEQKAKLHRVVNIEAALEQARIIIIATNRLPKELDLDRIKPGSIIFDASYPRLIPSNLRGDILVIDGAAIKPPGEGVDFNFYFGLPKGLCYPCMAEPMILALEQKFENYSLGKEPEPRKIREIMQLGKKHGFEIASLTSQERAISDEEILRIKRAAQGRS
ncbi:MAG: hypothetical protein NC828_04350 [Candidatus Omnitrophica bacterium]|nr:hypothetical protein [Candidatus Omnitrophota bacterium]